MNVQAMVKAMTPEVYDRLRTAVETGKWPDGSLLSEAQKENSLQAVMLYQSTVLKSEEHMTVGADGELVHKSKSALKQEFQPTIARFKTDDI